MTETKLKKIIIFQNNLQREKISFFLFYKINKIKILYFAEDSKHFNLSHKKRKYQKIILILNAKFNFTRLFVIQFMLKKQKETN